MINLIKNIAVILVLILGLTSFGFFINQIPIWSWVTGIFVIIRSVLKPIGIFWDLPSLYIVIGWGIKMVVSYFSFLATITFYRVFSH